MHICNLQTRRHKNLKSMLHKKYEERINTKFKYWTEKVT